MCVCVCYVCVCVCLWQIGACAAVRRNVWPMTVCSLLSVRVTLSRSSGALDRGSLHALSFVVVLPLGCLGTTSSITGPLPMHSMHPMHPPLPPTQTPLSHHQDRDGCGIDRTRCRCLLGNECSCAHQAEEGLHPVHQSHSLRHAHLLLVEQGVGCAQHVAGDGFFVWWPRDSLQRHGPGSLPKYQSLHRHPCISLYPSYHTYLPSTAHLNNVLQDFPLRRRHGPLPRHQG